MSVVSHYESGLAANYRVSQTLVMHQTLDNPNCVKLLQNLHVFI